MKNGPTAQDRACTPKTQTVSSCFTEESCLTFAGLQQNCCRTSAPAFNSRSAACHGAMRQWRRCRAEEEPEHYPAPLQTDGQAHSASTRNGRTVSSWLMPTATSLNAGLSGTRIYSV